MKKKMLFFSLLFFISFFLFSSLCFAKKDQVSLETKIGQMILVGFVSDEAFDTLLEDISLQKVSGAIFYKRNLIERTEVKDKIQKIYNSSPYLKPFILIDQEGGLVSRISNIHGEKKYLSAEKIEKEIKTFPEIYEYYSSMVSVLKDYGFNYNLAPCVDVAITEDNILNQNQRIYSSDEKVVYKYASAFVKAHLDNKVYTSIKHFPGHGSSIDDSHKNLPDITNTWQPRELFPFKEIIKEFPFVSVMVGHLLNKNIDKDRMSSLSKKTTDILVKQYNHKGLIIMDSVEMSSLDNYSCKEIIEYGINANVDLFLFGNHYFNHSDPHKYMSSKMFKDIVLELIKEGKVSEKQIDKTYKKIKYVKENMI